MRFTVTLLLLLWLGSAAQAEVVRLQTGGEDVVFTASGEDILIVGDHGDVLIQGDAAHVTVTGNHHDVVIGSAASLSVEGDHNDVSIARVIDISMGGSHNDVVVTDCRPNVRDGGSKNTIVSNMGVDNSGATSSVEQTEVVSSARKLTLEGAGVTQTVDAEGQDVILNGSGNRLTLKGIPTSLTVNGAMNRVDLETTLLIDVTGAQNTVNFRSGHPRIENAGVGNVISGP